MPHPPYAGLTGCTTTEQVAETIAAYGLGHRRKLMIGILATRQTLNGDPAKQHPERYPIPSVIPNLMSDDPRVLNLLHYHTNENHDLAAQLEFALSVSGDLCHGFQLNIAWPYPSEIMKFKDQFPGKKIVLQIGQEAMRVSRSIEAAVDRILFNYRGIVDYVLWDMSGGENQTVNSKTAVEFFDKMKTLSLDHDFGFAVAGGLTAETLDSIAPIVRKYPDISIDTEGGVRESPYGAMSMIRVHEYLTKALDILEG